jgi:EAL domain-containing protein (putative c-di-GMP-specific phosphodiesterase class I)
MSGHSPSAWSLECVSGALRGWEVPLRAAPFRVGRAAGLDLTLHAAAISKVHAHLVPTTATLIVHDLESRNGTFVNGERVVGSAPLVNGDIVGFADVEFRVVSAKGDEETTDGTLDSTGPLAEFHPQAHLSEGLRSLVRDAAVATLFQPIHELATRRLVGVEALGRGTASVVPSLPAELFRLALWSGLEAELSRLFRRAAVRDAAKRPGLGPVFLNTHPAEADPTELLASLRTLQVPGLRLVLELHERVVTQGIKELKDGLGLLGMELAFDDFGAGQARLMELADAPPHYLKFDMCFVRGLEAAGASRRQLLRSMVSLARELGTHTIAEGVETAAEAAACLELGFRSAQGYYFGRPVPIEELAAS